MQNLAELVIFAKSMFFSFRLVLVTIIFPRVFLFILRFQDADFCCLDFAIGKLNLTSNREQSC